ncbi:hypothetical protein [Brevibacillus migulae]|uniref:hypothetical protein n=1 Tax=Brevibacillus migulae TaxID=1644114 RepID=UPI00106E28A6|nr:hypothetical protein [Brevibacillus migulae]
MNKKGSTIKRIAAIAGCTMLLAVGAGTAMAQTNPAAAKPVTQVDLDNQRSPEVKVNSGFNLGKDNTYVLDTKYADVNGDGVRDHVLLVGYKEGLRMDIPSKDFRIVLRDGDTKQQLIGPKSKAETAVKPYLWIGDYNGDGVKDVRLTLPQDAKGQQVKQEWYTFN